MPNDYLTLKALARELDNVLKGGKIDKIFQPSNCELTFIVRSGNENRTLYFCANPSLPTLYITSRKFLNPENAPAFCMHLRKRLTHSIIDKISTFNNDRIVKFDITAKDDLMYNVEYCLFFEMLGRYTNIILTENGKITEAIRHVSLEDGERGILPGLTYRAPENARTSIENLDYLRAILSNGEGDVADKIYKTTSGLALSSAKYIAGEKSFPLTHNDIEQIVNRTDKLLNSGPTTPCVEIKDGKICDYYLTPYNDGKFEYFNTLSDAIDYSTFQKKAAERKNQRSKKIINAIKNALLRNEKKLSINRNKLLDCKNAENDRLKAELITANLYRIEKNASEFSCENYYTGKNVIIKLDTTLTPQKYAQKLYDRYNKLKRTEEIALAQIKEIGDNDKYLKSILSAVDGCQTESDYAEIETELLLGGYLNDKSVVFSKNKEISRPIEYIFQGTTILVGKNNLQNDKLTFKSAIKSDMWFHVKTFHGSHVVVRCGKELSPALLQFSAELAAYYSDAKVIEKVDVDYTRIKNVKRHPTSRPGLVTYADYSTVTVRPNQHKDYIKK